MCPEKADKLIHDEGDDIMEQQSTGTPGIGALETLKTSSIQKT